MGIKMQIEPGEWWMEGPSMVLWFNLKPLWKEGWRSEASGAAQERFHWIKREIPKPGDKSRLWGDRKRPSLTFPFFLLVSGAQEIVLVLGTDTDIFSAGQYLFRLGVGSWRKNHHWRRTWDSMRIGLAPRQWPWTMLVHSTFTTNVFKNSPPNEEKQANK